MTSYLVSRGINPEFLGIWRGAGSVVGLTGTLLYGFLASRSSLRVASQFSIIFFVAWLTLSFFGFLFESSGQIALWMLVIGVTFSRVGLWSFDMSINNMTQELVPESVRGVVGGTQESLQCFFMSLQFVFGLIWSKPSEFYILVIISYSSVIVAFLITTFGVYYNKRIPEGI